MNKAKLEAALISVRTLSHRQARYRGHNVTQQFTARASCSLHRHLTQDMHMNSLTTPPSNTSPADEDLAEQARPGHGIPSQDPDPAAQIALEPQEAEREAQSVLVGGGVVAGAAAGATIGVMVAGPVGVLVGATLGAVAGALGGAAAGAMASPEDSNSADTAPADTVRLHIDDSGGGGRPVVLIHGWPLSAQAWEPQVSVLQTAGYRVVAYDRRGFGRSDKPESGYSYDALADDLQRVMDQCGLQDVTLVGFLDGRGRSGALHRPVRRIAPAQRGVRRGRAALSDEDGRQPRRPAHAREGATDEEGARAGPQFFLRPVHQELLLGQRCASGH